MKIAKILSPTDFSAHSLEGLRTAEILCRQSGAELLIVHVLDPSEHGIHDAWPTTAPARADLENRLLETLSAGLNLTVDHALLEGDPAEEIVRLARQRHVDLIVMGSHGRTGIPRVLLGSVATKVVHQAPCAVLTMRPSVRLRGDVKAWAHRKPLPHESQSHESQSHESQSSEHLAAQPHSSSSTLQGD